MLLKKEYEELLNDIITPEKWNEIINLEYTSTEKVRTDYTGKKIHHLVVLGKGPNYTSPSGHSQGQWWCICDCSEHNILLVRGSNLSSSNTKSCGCHNDAVRKSNIKKAHEVCKVDLKNRQFGLIKPIKPLDERKGGSVVWECECSCGKIFKAAANELNANRIYSCGCANDSKGVISIKQILNENNIKYETEKTFSNCIFPDTNGKARFDFYIDNKFLLEFDGIQHFEKRDESYFRDNFEKRQEHDKFKNEWCKKNGIPLKRIPYTELKNISLDLIMGDKYLI